MAGATSCMRRVCHRGRPHTQDENHMRMRQASYGITWPVHTG